MKKVLLANNYTEAEVKKAILEFYPKSTPCYESIGFCEDNTGWTFFNALFFSYNVASTLGISGLVPLSTASQMFCIVYVLFGIPIAMIFIRVLGQNYAESKNEIVYLFGDKIPYSKYFSNFVFFASWSFLYYFVPPFIFMYTEDEWNYLDGLYFSTTVAAQIGLGDFFVGQNLKRDAYFAIYRLLLLAWMLHAMAFFHYTNELLSRVFSRYLLYEFQVDIKEKTFEFHRVFVNPECLDIHYRLLRAAKGVRKDISIWRSDHAAHSREVYLENHFRNMALAADALDIAIVNEMRKKGYSVDDDRDQLELN